jgi:hypothetical protein
MVFCYCDVVADVEDGMNSAVRKKDGLAGTLDSFLQSLTINLGSMEK